MVFCKGNLESVRTIKTILRDFGDASSLKMNLQKSRIYMRGVSERLKQQIRMEMGMVEGVLPTRYLGVPLHSRALQIAEYHPLVSTLESKIHSWSNRKLSYAGRVQLINSVLYSVLNFWVGFFLLPKGVIEAVEALCRRFLWSGGDEKMHTPLISWTQVCTPVEQGVLDLRRCLLGIKLLWLSGFLT